MVLDGPALHLSLTLPLSTCPGMDALMHKVQSLIVSNWVAVVSVQNAGLLHVRPFIFSLSEKQSLS